MMMPERKSVGHRSPAAKGGINMKTVKKLEALLAEYYETFKH